MQTIQTYKKVLSNSQFILKVPIQSRLEIVAISSRFVILISQFFCSDNTPIYL